MPTELIIDASLFIGIGIICWYLSYKYPLKGYKTLNVDVFDKWYVFIAVLSVIFIKIAILSKLSNFIISIFYLNSIQSFFNNQHFLLRFFIFFILADFGYYVIHRFLHSKVGWRFHSMHHGIEALNWISGVRGSPFHYLFVLAPVVFFQSLFLADVGYWTLLSFSIFDIANQHFCHSNIRLPFQKQLEYFLITPRMHFVHHNPEEKYTNSNYGLYLSIWDHMFRTYVNESDIIGEPKGKIGLDYKESKTSGFFALDKRKE